MTQDRCERCGNPAPAYDSVNYGSGEGHSQLLCSHCFNAEIAELNGLVDFENVRIEPIQMMDCSGAPHLFHFQVRLLGNILALDAFELQGDVPTGYRFQMIGDSEDDVFVLLGRLVEKIRRALSIKHIDDHQRSIVDMTVRGRIGWNDANDGHVPLVVVDGKEVSWDDFGRMLMAFEGWQFKLQIGDLSEEM